MSNGVTTASKIVLDLLANSIFGADNKIELGDASLEEVFAEAKSQTVLAVSFDALPRDFEQNNPEIYKKWQNLAFWVMQKNLGQLHSNARLDSLFKDAGIPICTIKGFASNYYYPKKHLRQMGDIDFIVPEDRVEDGKKLLSRNDFKCTDEQEIHDYHIGYKKNHEIYEMHKGVTKFFDENGYIKKYIKDIFSDTIMADFGGAELTIPGPFAHGLVMLLHMQKHMIDGGGIGLRHLCDWAVFVDSIENDEWKSIFEEKFKVIKLWKFAQVLAKISAVYLNMSEKEWFSEIDSDIADELLADIVNGGNFGRKDIKRSQELFFMSHSSKEKSKIKLYAKGYIKKVYSWKHFFEYHKYLLPFGMIAYFFRTTFMVLFMKKKLNISDTYKSGNIRSALYDEIFK